MQQQSLLGSLTEPGKNVFVDSVWEIISFAGPSFHWIDYGNWLLQSFLALWVTSTGAFVGSFLNVVVYRLPAGLSLSHPASRCPKCETPIRWHDNVPVLAWFVLRGRCRACGQTISGRYPTVEAAMAAVFLLIAVVEPAPDGRARLLARLAEPPFLWTTVWFLYIGQVTLISTLVAGALILWDGQRPPWRLFAPVLFAGLASPWLISVDFPLVRQLRGGQGIEASLMGVSESLLGLAAGAVLGVAASLPLSTSDPGASRLRIAGLGACGLILGWTPALLVALASLILEILASRLAPARSWWGLFLSGAATLQILVARPVAIAWPWLGAEASSIVFLTGAALVAGLSVVAASLSRTAERR